MAILRSLLLLLLAASGVLSFSPLGAAPSHSTATRLYQAKTAVASMDYQTKIDACNAILYRAAETKDEDSDAVFEALSDLEKLMRTKCKDDPKAASEILDNLNASWRLVFTTGTKESQNRLKGGRINYFPIKAVQSFDTTTSPYGIENGIYLGDFNLLKFTGEFDFDLKKRKLEFDFNVIRLFSLFDINLKPGQAAELGSSSGLGSSSNVENAKRGRQAFFNWISADEKIATARGGGGGLALWKRIEE